jgi:hypothetical protein
MLSNTHSYVPSLVIDMSTSHKDSKMPEDSEMTEVQGLTLEMMDPLFDYRDHLTPAQFAAYVEQKGKALAQLIESGVIEVAEGKRLHVNKRGFVTAVGYDVLPVERLTSWPPKMFFGREDKRRFSSRRTESLHFLAELDSAKLSPQNGDYVDG